MEILFIRNKVALGHFYFSPCLRNSFALFKSDIKRPVFLFEVVDKWLAC